MIFVDGVDIGNPDDVALRDRRTLSADGVFIVVVTVSAEDGSSVAEPELIFRGVPFLDDAADELLDELRDEVERSLSVAANEGVSEPVLLQEDLHDDLANVRLRAPEAPADDPAGRRRGLETPKLWASGDVRICRCQGDSVTLSGLRARSQL